MMRIVKECRLWSACLVVLSLPGWAAGTGTRSFTERDRPRSLVLLVREEPHRIANHSCVLTLGFWKSHPRVWPLASLTLGTVSYTQFQSLAILNAPPQGNGLVNLAQQLIAAKLNVANGSDPSMIAGVIAEADALIDGLVVPPIGLGSLPSSSSSGLAESLDRYNNGLLGVQHCDELAVEEAAWGRVKALYRDLGQ